MIQQELYYILTIAREKNITRAAEKLHITQPALSLYLNRIEKQLGTILFDRNGMKLTYAGKKYIQMAIQIERLYKNFKLDLCSITQQEAGQLTIGTSPHIGSFILPYVLSSFSKKYPNIEISLVEARSNELEDKLLKNEIDLALIHLPLITNQISYETIGTAPYVAAIDKNSPLLKSAYRNPEDNLLYIDIEQLENQPFIMAFPHQGVRRIVDIILAKANIIPHIAYTTSSVETALLFAGAGMGISLLPEDYISLFNCGEFEPIYCHLDAKYEPYWTFVIAHTKPQMLTIPEQYFIELARTAFNRTLH